MQFLADLLNVKTEIALTVNCAHSLVNTIFGIYLQRFERSYLKRR